MKALLSFAVVFFVIGLAMPDSVRCEVTEVDAAALRAKAPDSVAVLEIEHDGKSLGDIVIRFYPEAAPQHVANFKTLANRGDYDGTTFHRIIPGFIQTNAHLQQDGNDGLVIKERRHAQAFLGQFRCSAEKLSWGAVVDPNGK